MTQPFRRSALLSCLALASFALHAEPTECQAGPDIPSKFAQLRPTPTATCPYDFAEFQRRFRRLFEIPATSYEIGLVQQLFGLPPLTTMFDDPRTSHYDMIVDGAGGWRVQIVEREGWWTAGAAGFKPGPHPVALDSMATAKVDIDISLTRAPDHRQPDRCFDVAAVDAAAGAAGWRKGQAMVIDAVVDAPIWTAPHDTRLAATGAHSLDPGCLDGLVIRKR